jgi:ubiquinol-cytochrome c reductase cytochrome b subunit
VATVIINLASALPWLGNDLKELVWGAYSVSSPTITRFFTLHYTLAFVLAAFVALHFIALHDSGSGNPLGITSNTDRLPIHPYFTIKDGVTVTALLLITAILIAYMPNSLGQGWPFLYYERELQCAICWNNYLNENTLFISGLVLCPNKVRISYKEKNNYYLYREIKLNQQVFIRGLETLIDTSETIRTQKRLQFLSTDYESWNDSNEMIYKSFTFISKNKGEANKLKNIFFNQWLAGIIDGDGYLLVTKQGYSGCEITTGLEDEKMLTIIQNKLGGSLKLRSGVKAVRYRLHNKKGMIHLIERINGLIQNSKRLPQLHKVCQVLNIIPLSPIPLTKTNMWFLGCFDADGTINYYYQKYTNAVGEEVKRTQLTISVSNKYLVNIQEYKKIFGGNIYYSSGLHGHYKWTISSKEEHLKWYYYFLTYPSSSVKSKRNFLIKQYYELVDIKAYRSPKGSAQWIAWSRFEKKWNRI